MEKPVVCLFSSSCSRFARPRAGTARGYLPHGQSSGLFAKPAQIGLLLLDPNRTDFSPGALELNIQQPTRNVQYPR